MLPATPWMPASAAPGLNRRHHLGKMACYQLHQQRKGKRQVLVQWKGRPRNAAVRRFSPRLYAPRLLPASLTGFEPAPSTLTRWCSTVELKTLATMFMFTCCFRHRRDADVERSVAATVAAEPAVRLACIAPIITRPVDCVYFHHVPPAGVEPASPQLEAGCLIRSSHDGCRRGGT